MENIIYVDGIKIKTEKIVCKRCGVVDIPDYKLLASNKAMQIICKECGAWNGNYRYRTNGDYIMPFGKHKGEPVCELPVDYLSWLYENADLRGGLLAAVESALENAERVC